MLSEEHLSKLRRLMEARDLKDSTEKAAKKANADFREAEAELYDLLDEGPLDRIPPVDLGPPWGKVSFHKRETPYGRIIPGMEQEALRHYEQRAMIDEVTVPKFVMKRINEEVRDCLEQGKPMPPGIDFRMNRGVTITRQKN